MIEYRGFTIVRDQLLGWSLIDRKGTWACSKGNIFYLLDVVDRILEG